MGLIVNSFIRNFLNPVGHHNSKNHVAKTGNQLQEQFSLLSFFADYFKLISGPGDAFSFEK